MLNRIESSFKEIRDNLPTPMNKARKHMKQAEEEAKELQRELHRQQEETKKYVLPTLPEDYAKAQGRKLSDYEMLGLSGFGSAWGLSEATIKAVTKLNRRRLETKCEVVTGTTFDSVATNRSSGPSSVEVGAKGTGLRLKSS